MGKGTPSGGGAPTSTTSTVSQSNLPEYARPYFENLMNRSEGVTTQAYQPYGGPRVQDFKEDQYAGINAVRANQGSYQPMFDAASGAFGAAGGTMGQAGGMFGAAASMAGNAQFDPTQVNNSYNPTNVANSYTAHSYNPDNWNSATAAQYMSPYMQNVVDIQKREANRQFGIQNVNQDTQATQAGAFGGYRDAIVDVENQRNQNMLLDDIQAKGLNDAYGQGIGAFNADRSAQMNANNLNNAFGQAQAGLGLQAGQMNNQFGQAAAGLGIQAGDINNRYGLAAADLGLRGGQLMLGAGQGMTGLGQAQAGLGGAMAGLGQATQAAGYTDANASLGIGGMHQALDQQRLDTAYSDFVSQRDYDRQNLNWLSGILRGVPVTANTSTSQYQPAPNQASQIAGLGLGAAGLARMMG